jgi:hypothetical protein
MDLIMSIVEWIWRFYLGFCCVFTTFFMVKFFTGIKPALDEARRDKAIAILKSVKLVSVEVVADRVMMYDAINHAFICQAATEEELWALAKDLFPSKELLLK